MADETIVIEKIYEISKQMPNICFLVRSTITNYWEGYITYKSDPNEKQSRLNVSIGTSQRKAIEYILCSNIGTPIIYSTIAIKSNGYEHYDLIIHRYEGHPSSTLTLLNCSFMFNLYDWAPPALAGWVKII